MGKQKIIEICLFPLYSPIYPLTVNTVLSADCQCTFQRAYDPSQSASWGDWWNKWKYFKYKIDLLTRSSTQQQSPSDTILIASI